MKNILLVSILSLFSMITGYGQLMNPHQIDELNHVTFRVNAPGAQDVKVINLSDEKAMGAAEYQLTKGTDGVWTVTTNPCRPGFHYYQLSIDGFECADPASQAYFGWGKWSSGLEVRDKNVTFYQPKNNPAGEVVTHWYYSDITRTMRKCLVYMPPSYRKEDGNKYPVLYLQHGAGESELGWTMQGKMNLIMDNLIAEGQAVEMLVVMDNGYAAVPGAENPARPGGADNKFSEVLLTEVIPEIDASFRTLDTRESRAIAGLSMGAGQAMKIGLTNPDVFSAVGAFSGGVWNFDRENSFNGVFKDTEKLNGQLNLLWIGCGNLDRSFSNIRQFHIDLEKYGVDHVWHEMDGSHEWQVWRHHLHEFARQVFKQS